MVVSKEDLEELLEDTVNQLLEYIEQQHNFVLYAPVYEAYERIIKATARRAVFIGRELNKLQDGA